MDQEKLITIDEIQNLRTEAGQTEAKIKASATQFNSTPESGTFKVIGIQEFDIEGVGKRKSVGLFLTDGQFVSENALNLQELLSEMTKIKSGKRKDSFMLKSKRLTDLSKFGSSADARLIALQGKSFKTTKKDARVYKAEFLDAVKFDDVCQTSDSAISLKNALECTEIRTGYIFEV